MASPRDPFDLLVAEGATPEEAACIVDTLLGSGMGRPRIRQWLAHPSLCYPMLMALITAVPDEPVELRNAPILAVRKQAHLVVRLAKQFAAADQSTREVALAFACNLEKVEWLSHGDPQRLEELVRITRLLTEKLKKNVHVADFPGWAPDGNYRHTLADRLAGDELWQVRRELEEGTLDPEVIRTDPRVLVSSSWGGDARTNADG